MSKNGEDIDNIIDYISESLKNKLAHETTIKLKELYPNLDEDKIQKLIISSKKINESRIKRKT
jgi:phage gp29-like protein